MITGPAFNDSMMNDTEAAWDNSAGLDIPDVTEMMAVSMRSKRGINYLDHMTEANK